MSVLRVGIADYESMKERTMQIARGELRRGKGDPKVWFTSVESLVETLSSDNHELLNTIGGKSPKSIEIVFATLPERRKL